MEIRVMCEAVYNAKSNSKFLLIRYRLRFIQGFYTRVEAANPGARDSN